MQVMIVINAPKLSLCSIYYMNIGGSCCIYFLKDKKVRIIYPITTQNYPHNDKISKKNSLVLP